jgi:hypothetical protein
MQQQELTEQPKNKMSKLVPVVSILIGIIVILATLNILNVRRYNELSEDNQYLREELQNKSEQLYLMELYAQENLSRYNKVYNQYQNLWKAYCELLSNTTGK